MIAASELLLGRSAAQFLQGNGSRLTLVATDTSTAAAALPAGAKLLIVRALAPIWLRFGTSGMDAAQAGDDSILFVQGEAPQVVPKVGTALMTHVRIVRADDEVEEAAVQLEQVATVG